MLEREKIIIIISTIVSICIMLSTGIDRRKEETIIQKVENSGNQTQAMIDNSKNTYNTTGEFNSLNDNKVMNASENKENIGDQNKIEKAIEKNDGQSYKTCENKKNEEYDIPIAGENSKTNEDTEKSVAIFKVNRDEIINELSFIDKEKLLLISSKLKASDYKNINNLLWKDVQGEGVLESLKILKARLSKKDYSKIKEIFNKFINMDLVDN